ncbi:hypothetical protein CLAFUW4_14063 [Fulvia fulva]|uniref:Uncharacterized protein n=1 Tax=Passalora fulva TaxID=5499 RepID=A0A9Q8UW91_PASFU|nr:uncharacterized protein CLAFUR5_13901 [Fulvia fulva]KAK4610696.1 hypothetical protein CLAFUR4_14066 [Fulvia fulva]KAK4611406.1 hypothetical protein CLAFUR0_14070 [Fulvia fulva]UJO24745.1 hypothetical protein CLAFUR5_13901 [Fulvia fulva]WPV21843.1 hypothetical protein CLAFUW4_14063 [Fulvia fulva]WPV37257.1 hypothetical protein CLAFUW7_14074 [Fulvia fulva]
MTISLLPWSLLALVEAVLADPLPYNPARILIAPNASSGYVFQASAETAGQAVLSTFALGKRFATTGLTTIAVSNIPSFLQDGGSSPYSATVDPSGNITVITGDCIKGSDSTELWRFSPGHASSEGDGTWAQFTTSRDELASTATWTGANYLANAIAFSGSVSQDAADMGYYMFGGMCPFANASTANWTSDAGYSQNMLSFNPDVSTSHGTNYDVSSVATRGPPIPEAGFTITGLTPTYSMNATGQPQSQQQDFLLIGGHTQQAFINMSNVALFSLPQESWAFVPVEQPSGARTDLAKRQSSAIIEPRSGHTAVLSADGTSIIVLGGWVGDISNPAQPQLAILHLGSEYGGAASEAWTWSIPDQSSDFFSEDTGIYGHGAAMLPGGLMMIFGGYSISASSTAKPKRAASQNTYLYNATSGAWVDSYNPPSNLQVAEDNRASTSGPLSTTSQQTGLGVGLGIGVLALAGVTCLYFWYMRKLKKEREDRERDLMCHSSDGSFMALERPYNMDNAGVDGRGDDVYAMEHDSADQMKQTGSTGLFSHVPSPTRGLRKGMQDRPYMFHAAPRYDDNRASRGSGNIHPILERPDEDDSIRGDEEMVMESDAVQRLRRVEHALDPGARTPERSLRELQRALQAGSTPIRDPFADPDPNPLGSHPVSPISPETLRRVPTHAGRDVSPVRRPLSTEMDGSMNWMIVEQQDGPFDPSDPSSASSNGRSSPTRTDDRTSSTLSERSQRSHASSTSITRTMSTRTGALLAAALSKSRGEVEYDSGAQSPVDERTSTMGTASSTGRKSPYYFYRPTRKPVSGARSPVESRARHLAGPSNAEKSTDSFMTAKSNFAQLQDEGQALLGGRPLMDRDDPYQRAMAATGPDVARRSSTMDHDLSIAPPRRQKGLIGSLRRALTAMSNDRSFSFTSNAAEKQYEDEPRTSSSSPTRSRKPVLGTTATPRRAVSDGGAWLKQKRGENDWEQDKSFAPYRDNPHLDAGDWGESLARRTSQDDRRAGEEWDVEGAVSKRDVQVMFTVPKARLRVVNADIDRASMRSASDGAVSRNNSVREAIKHKESMRSMRSRSDGTGEAGRTMATVEESSSSTSAATTAREPLGWDTPRLR